MERILFINNRNLSNALARHIQSQGGIERMFEQLFEREMENYFEQEMYEIALQRSIDDYKMEKKNNIKIEHKNIKTYEETDKKFDNCSICLNNFENTDKITITNCEHYFHSDCLEEWGKYKPECPMCKKEIEHTE
jgi:hypothetical protein